MPPSVKRRPARFRCAPQLSPAAFENLEIRRLLSAATGAVDLSFGEAGIASIGVGSTFSVYASAIDSADDVLTAGTIQNADGSQTVNVTRLTSAGTPDASFGSDGVARAGAGDDALVDVHALAVQAEGKIIVGGDAISDDQGQTAFALFRFNADGTPDASFGVDGEVMTSFAGTSLDSIYGLSPLPGGKVLVAGNVDSSIALARYNADGSLDATFGTQGLVITAPAADTFTEADGGLTTLPNGEILVVGDAGLNSGSEENPAFADVFAYYTADGQPLAFNAGPARDDYPGVIGFSVRPNGQIVTLQQAFNSFADAIFNPPTLERHNADGSLDARFDGAAGPIDTPTSLAVAPNGQFMVGGGVGANATGVERFNADGSLDTSFGSGGLVVTGGVEYAGAVAVDPTGSILATGIGADSASFVAVRVLPDVGIAPGSATLTARNLHDLGQQRATLSVTYSAGTDASTLDDNDLTVTDAAGDTLAVSFDSVTANAGGSLTATYELQTGAGRDFNSSDDGVYSVSLNPAEVMSAEGVAVAAGVLGALRIAIPAAPAGLAAPTGSLSGNTLTTPATVSAMLSVTYHSPAGIDATTVANSSITITSPDDSDTTLSATLGVVTANADGSVTATYAITKDDGTQFFPIDNGSYAVSIADGTVADAYGNYIPDATLGNFTVNVGSPPTGATAPTAMLVGVDTSDPSTTRITITYRSSTPIAIATLNTGDLTATATDGVGFTPEFQSSIANADGSVTATYTLASTEPLHVGPILPSGGLRNPIDSTLSGDSTLQTCALALNADQVSDVQGTTASAATLGTFTAMLPDDSGMLETFANGAIPVARGSQSTHRTTTASHHHRHHHHRYGHARSAASRHAATSVSAGAAAWHRGR